MKKQKLLKKEQSLANKLSKYFFSHFFSPNFLFAQPSFHKVIRPAIRKIRLHNKCSGLLLNWRFQLLINPATLTPLKRRRTNRMQTCDRPQSNVKSQIIINQLLSHGIVHGLTKARTPVLNQGRYPGSFV